MILFFFFEIWRIFTRWENHFPFMLQLSLRWGLLDKILMGEGCGEKSRTFCVNLCVLCSYWLTHCIKNFKASGLLGQPHLPGPMQYMKLMRKPTEQGDKMLTQHPCPSGAPVKTALNWELYSKGNGASLHLISPRRGTTALAPKDLISHLHHHFHMVPQSPAKREGTWKDDCPATTTAMSP